MEVAALRSARPGHLRQGSLAGLLLVHLASRRMDGYRTCPPAAAGQLHQPACRVEYSAAGVLDCAPPSVSGCRVLEHTAVSPRSGALVDGRGAASAGTGALPVS